MGQTETNSKTVDLNSTMSIILLNINALSIPIKRMRFSDPLRKQTRPSYMLFTRNLLYI